MVLIHRAVAHRARYGGGKFTTCKLIKQFMFSEMNRPNLNQIHPVVELRKGFNAGAQLRHKKT